MTHLAESESDFFYTSAPTKGDDKRRRESSQNQKESQKVDVTVSRFRECLKVVGI